MTVTLSVPATESAAALRLRPWRIEDVPAVVAAHTDPSMHRWLTTSIPDAAAGRRWIRAEVGEWSAGTRFSFAVVADRDDDTPLGLVSVRRGDREAVIAEVGYWTVAQARGQGIAARALDAVSAWAFSELPVGKPLEALELFHRADNEASCRVAAKTGFALDRLLPANPPAFPAIGHLHLRAAG